MSKIDDVARGLLIDAFITYAAICKEKGYGVVAHHIWKQALGDMLEDLTLSTTREAQIAESLLGEFGTVEDDHVFALIEERRGLIRDTMREEMADLEAASPSPEDTEGIRDREQG